jgi:hypothetical protein
MKKSLVFSLILCILYLNPANSQVGGLLKKVKNSVANEILGNNKGDAETKTPEPKCACDPAEFIVDLGGKLNLGYSELDVSVNEDGSLLLKDKISGKYYIARGGEVLGPYSEGDPKLGSFNVENEGGNISEVVLSKNKNYISRSGDKYLITFNGVKYGPYAQINSFAVTKSKNKFAATVTETIVATEDQGKKMDEAMKNAKSDQERMELAMKFSEQMTNKMLQSGDPTSILPKLITNVTGATFDPKLGGTLSCNMKYDDILVNKFDVITDLMGNKVISIKREHAMSKDLFVNSANTKYAVHNYGTLIFSDGTSLSELFNVQLIKADGKVYIAYMYYSPKKNAIMQCKILF